MKEFAVAQRVGKRYLDVQHDAVAAGHPLLDGKKIKNAVDAEKWLLFVLANAADDLDGCRDKSRAKGTSGSTVVAGVFAPDDSFIWAGMGDSPMVAFYLNNRGTVKALEILGKLHNPPEMTNALHEHVSAKSYIKLHQNNARKFRRIFNISAMIEDEDRYILFAAMSDGVLAKVKSQIATEKDKREQEQTNLQIYRKPIRSAFRRYSSRPDGRLQAIVDAIVVCAENRQVKKSDNISAAGFLYDRKNPPKGAGAIMAADGFQDYGAEMSALVQKAFVNNMQNSIAPRNGIQDNLNGPP